MDRKFVDIDFRRKKNSLKALKKVKLRESKHC